MIPVFLYKGSCTYLFKRPYVYYSTLRDSGYWKVEEHSPFVYSLRYNFICRYLESDT